MFRKHKTIYSEVSPRKKLQSTKRNLNKSMVTIQEEIIEALKTAKEAQTINIEMDGGGFNDKQ